MLVWEEEVKPSTVHAASLAQRQPSLAQAAHLSLPVLNDSVREDVATPIVDSAIADPLVDAAATTRRVKAADKRIINGRTDVNQLVPFKYK